MTEKGLKRTCQDEGENGENLDFYHGLLPREDLPYLLKRNGDFLIRTSEVKPGQETRQIILSVCINDVDTIAERDIKHIVIQKSSDGKFGI
uniref:SH2 domain-containing protein n=1 Tax=Panagrolaimus sp. JU765 TaxID=591449 RepID=A0AC34RR41_9BILA